MIKYKHILQVVTKLLTAQMDKLTLIITNLNRAAMLQQTSCLTVNILGLLDKNKQEMDLLQSNQCVHAVKRISVKLRFRYAKNKQLYLQPKLSINLKTMIKWTKNQMVHKKNQTLQESMMRKTLFRELI